MSKSLVSRFPLVVWWIAAIALVALSQFAQHELDTLYKLSQFPVNFFEGQTSFDAAKVKAWYAVLAERGTFGTYVWVQIFDYGYMLTVFAAFFTLMAAVYRSLPVTSWARGIARAMILIAPIAPLFDALENLVSFVMLADPVNFADWLVYPYSAFACLKFGIYLLTYLWTIVGVVIALVSALIGLFRPRAQHAA
ncbi:hypothetical protein ABAC460_18100 [Asticcacaulis sp. AC460]|uniref:hypothetical protein n=1 Tax=Asticcacaulis sp. AC460 TaxID=1282360 RepID=UPI0003C3FC6E|nr:hypothetical protein [Asticcacaulis sp. AC460]ESQ87841.1 hypothetical protein ABAC460_18100 [Asticcacaulis sp. AC460]